MKAPGSCAAMLCGGADSNNETASSPEKRKRRFICGNLIAMRNPTEMEWRRFHGPRTGGRCAAGPLSYVGAALVCRRLLPQPVQQAVDLAAVALDDRREFIALGHLHADAGNIHIGDLGLATLVNDIPVDLDRVAAATHDLAADDDFVAVRPVADDPERFAAILGEAAVISLRDVLLEQLEKL